MNTNTELCVVITLKDGKIPEKLRIGENVEIVNVPYKHKVELLCNEKYEVMGPNQFRMWWRKEYRKVVQKVPYSDFPVDKNDMEKWIDEHRVSEIEKKRCDRKYMLERLRNEWNEADVQKLYQIPYGDRWVYGDNVTSENRTSDIKALCALGLLGFIGIVCAIARK